MSRNWLRTIPGENLEAVMPPDDFRDLYLAYLRNEAPEAGIEIVDSLEVKVALEDETSHSVFLDNAYQQYEADPGNRDEIIEVYLASFLEVARQEEAGIDPDQIVPVIKDRGWLEEVEASLEERGSRPEEMPTYLSDPYNSELAIFYAEDSPRNIRYLTEDAVAELKVDRDQLKERAIANLERLTGEFEVMGGDGIYLISAGGDYEASLLLVSDLWDREQMPVEGDFIAAIPARDLLIVTGSENPEGIRRVREMASEGAAQFSYRLSPVLFVRKNGVFEVFEG